MENNRVVGYFLINVVVVELQYDGIMGIHDVRSEPLSFGPYQWMG